MATKTKAPAKKLVATQAISFDGRSLSAGDSISESEISLGALNAMLRMGQLVPQGEYEPPPKPETDDSDWLSTPVTALNLDAGIAKSLVSAGLPSVRAALQFGKEKGALTEIDGIDEKADKAFQDAVAKLKSSK